MRDKLKIILLIAAVGLFLVGVNSVSAVDLKNSTVSHDGTFDELNNEISKLNNGDYYKLNHEYVFNKTDNPSSGNVIEITKDNVTIDGNCHSIIVKDSKKEFGIFKVTGNNVTLINFDFYHNKQNYTTNRSDMKSPITWIGENGHLRDCRFDSTKAFHGGAITWSGSNGTLQYNKFINTHALGVGGSIYLSGENTTLRNCYFLNCESRLSNEEIYIDRKHKNITLVDCGFISSGNVHVIDGNYTKIDTKNLFKVANSPIANQTVDLVPMIYRSLTLGGVNKENNISYYATIKGDEYVSTTVNYLKNGVTYLKDYHFKNLTCCDDIYANLLNGNYLNEYQFIVNTTVNNTKDYENILKHNAGYYITPLESVLTSDIGSLSKIKYVKALNIEFLRQLEFKATKAISPNDLNFDIVNINGHNSTIKGSFKNRNEDNWAKINQKIFSASNLVIEGFNSAVDNNAGNCIFNNVTFKDNKMDYWLQRDWGGAILNTGSVICNNCSFMGNYAKNGGAIFSQGIFITNNCTFLDNKAYGKGNDICVGDGGILIMDNKNITASNCTGGICFAKSLTGIERGIVISASIGGSFIVGFTVGFFTANPLIGAVAGGACGALIGSLASSYIISKTYDANYNRLKSVLF